MMKRLNIRLSAYICLSFCVPQFFHRKPIWLFVGGIINRFITVFWHILRQAVREQRVLLVNQTYIATWTSYHLFIKINILFKFIIESENLQRFKLFYSPRITWNGLFIIFQQILVKIKIFTLYILLQIWSVARVSHIEAGFLIISRFCDITRRMLTTEIARALLFTS